MREVSQAWCLLPTSPVGYLIAQIDGQCLPRFHAPARLQHRLSQSQRVAGPGVPMPRVDIRQSITQMPSQHFPVLLESATYTQPTEAPG